MRVELRDRCCNLCKRKFTPTSRFERYCDSCRDENEIFHYSDWMEYA